MVAVFFSLSVPSHVRVRSTIMEWKQSAVWSLISGRWTRDASGGAELGLRCQWQTDRPGSLSKRQQTSDEPAPESARA